MAIYFYNTLHRKKELFVPIEPGAVRIYTCGPTVYGPPHIGNLRAYIFTDVLRRTLELAGLHVKHAMNITDVGHLTSDSDEGEDKLEVGATREGLDPLDVARKYEEVFWRDFDRLNCRRPHAVARATEAISRQIELVARLLDGGYAYRTSAAIYFDTRRLSDYGKLTGQALAEKIVAGRADVVVDSNKRHPADFALWFFTTGRFAGHILRWPSPWGDGFPGWHLECSAISRQLLGQPFDIHTGGVDHIGTHHTNEIAQSEAAYGQPLANYWLHNEHLLVNKSKMSKSEDTFLTLDDSIAKGFTPLDFRYLCLMSHYRSKMNFTWDGLRAARTTRQKVAAQLSHGRVEQSDHGLTAKLYDAIFDDLDTPKLLALLHEANDMAAWQSLDAVLGLGLRDTMTEDSQCVPPHIQTLFEKYKLARRDRDYDSSDAIRSDLNDAGYTVSDAGDESELKKK